MTPSKKRVTENKQRWEKLFNFRKKGRNESSEFKEAHEHKARHEDRRVHTDPETSSNVWKNDTMG